MLLPALSMAKESNKLISCINHVLALKLYMKSDRFAKDNALFQLPYNKDLPGYAVIATINEGNDSPMLRCNHGATKGWYGGWQYLNLPMPTIYKLHKEWVEKYPEDEMPVLWCGKGSLHNRVTLCIQYIKKQNNGIDFNLVHGSTNYKEIEYLNKCLKKIGEKPVSFDIPDGIDWSKYKQEIENKKDTRDAVPSPQI